MLRVEVTVVVMPVLWCRQAVARRHEVMLPHACPHQASIVGPPPQHAYDAHCGYSFLALKLDIYLIKINELRLCSSLSQCVTFFFFVLLDLTQY